MKYFIIVFKKHFIGQYPIFENFNKSHTQINSHLVYFFSQSPVSCIISVFVVLGQLDPFFQILLPIQHEDVYEL